MAQSSWYELSFTVAREQADELSDALLEVGALSVQVTDAYADTEREQAIFGEPDPAGLVPDNHDNIEIWQTARFRVLAPSHEDAMAQLSLACQAMSLPMPVPISSQRIEQQDWVQTTQAQFEPFAVADTLWIAPSWHQDKPIPADHIDIMLDPGLAFGTGSHPTTRMCLQWLCANQPEGIPVIDYGCGSGILAIAAAKLGATPVCGIDIDPQALTSATDNAKANNVTLITRAATDTMPEAAPVVVANILAGPLKVLAPLLESLVAPGGSLILAGLLDPQAQAVSAAYPSIELRPWCSDSGWTLLVGTRSAD